MLCVCACSCWFIVFACLRVDPTLADGVYQLVPQQEQQQLQESTQFEQEPTQFQTDQDPSQVSEEPKAIEGKHRSMVPYFETLMHLLLLYFVHLRSQDLLDTLVAFSLGIP